MKNILRIFVCLAVALLPLAAEAYVGPGAGLSLLGALWALLIAVGTAVVFVVAWPIRRVMRRRSKAVVSAHPRERRSETDS
jgi:membrane protein implicated in regulation of membrane protease activity